VARHKKHFHPLKQRLQLNAVLAAAKADEQGSEHSSSTRVTALPGMAEGLSLAAHSAAEARDLS